MVSIDIDLRKKYVKKFLTGHKPIMLEVDGTLRPIAHIKDRILKWVIRNPSQRLREMDAIAKDDSVIDRVVGQADTIEVADMVDGTIYSISMDEFMANRQPLYTSSTGKQYVVNRKHWKQTSLVPVEDTMEEIEWKQSSIDKPLF
jgi:hypothetical protein|tara:strand:+ start:205 stop:639 length:435 start_codon:yes stop_codon:yes gene_type:complete